MPTITVLPHPDYAPAGTQVHAPPGGTICDALLAGGVEIDRGKGGACTTCHVVIAQGFSSLSAVEEREEDQLDQAWGLQPHSRLSRQAEVAEEDVVVEIPRYSFNLVRERG